MKRAAVCLMLTIGLSGCGRILHEMQPHRLWRLNYYSSPGRDGGLYSVPDTLTEALPAGNGRQATLTAPANPMSGTPWPSQRSQ